MTGISCMGYAKPDHTVVQFFLIMVHSLAVTLKLQSRSVTGR